jgi:uncharacterized membrane protein
MPAQRKMNQSTRLTAAGLMAVTAATLLMMAWAIFPTAAGAAPGDDCPSGWTTKVESQSDGDLDNVVLPAGTRFCAKGGTNNTGILVADGSTTLAVYLGTGQNVSHYVIYPPTTTTTTTTTPTTTTTTPTTTTSTPTTTTTTTPTTTTTTPTTTTTSTPTTTTTTTPTTTTTTTPTTTTTTPGGGGGGGGGGTTTTPTTTPTTPPTVGPTTIHNTSSATTRAEVLPTTVRPGGTAFTGVENVVPIGAIALMLMTSGSGLLWVGSRRRRHDGSENED